MNTMPFPDNPPKKRSRLATFAKVVGGYWVTELLLLFVVGYGLYHGWSEARQWSDAFFYAAVAQLLIAAVPLLGGSGEFSAAGAVRYIANGDVSETRGELAEIAQRKQAFSVRVFAGCILTGLIAVIFTF